MIPHNITSSVGCSYILGSQLTTAQVVNQLNLRFLHCYSRSRFIHFGKMVFSYHRALMMSIPGPPYIYDLRPQRVETRIDLNGHSPSHDTTGPTGTQPNNPPPPTSQRLIYVLILRVILLLIWLLVMAALCSKYKADDP